MVEIKAQYKFMNNEEWESAQKNKPADMSILEYIFSESRNWHLMPIFDNPEEYDAWHESQKQNCQNRKQQQ